MVDTVITRLDSKGSLQNQLISPSLDDTIIKDDTRRPKSLLPRRRKFKSHIPVRPKKPVRPKYFTSNANVTKESGFIKKPYSFPSDLAEFAHKVMHKAWRKEVQADKLQKTCAQKHNLKSQLTSDVLHRLHVAESDPTSMKTILEIDNNFFDDVKGRPINDNMDLRTYVDYNRALLRTKVVDGWRKDEIMLIEEQLIHEQNMIKKIQDNFKNYVDKFEEFLMIDHTTALQLLKESDSATQEYFDLYQQYKREKKKNSAAVSAAYKSEDIWLNCRSYQEFLYVISPMGWKQIHPMDGYEDWPTEGITDVISRSFSTILSECTSSTLHVSVSRFRNVTTRQTTPTLYFTKPSQLMEVFRYMEVQNLNSLLYSEELAIPLQTINQNLRKAEKTFDEEIRHLQEIIDGLEGGILWEEKRAAYLEQLGQNLIKGEFKNLITDPEVLNLHVLVEDVYETRIGPNDANLTMLEMMNAISRRYRDEIVLFDKVPSEEIALLEGNMYNEQMRIMKLAEKAARQNAEYERTTKALTKAFALPPIKSAYKQPVKRSKLPRPHEQPLPPPRRLTESEETYLEYFTDYCELTDDVKDYGIDISKRIEEKKAVATQSTTERVILRADYSSP